ncbi:MAG: ABC1 kinase family protein [Planctomycetota bacterium]|jgi:ubiquinone biosynthesis protein
MTPLQISRNIRSLKRLRQIATTLTQHGFGHVVDRIDMGRYVPVWMHRKSKKEAEVIDQSGSSLGRRLAQVCSDLGPTFIKLAQLISSKPDIAPPEVLDELRKLQDDVPAFGTLDAMKIIEQDLEQPADECFASIEPHPIASGSIGQVHCATTHSGKPVVVKIQRPGIDDIIAGDMQLLRWMAETLENVMPELGVYQPSVMVNELEQMLTRELDYINEASTTQRFRQAFEDTPNICIPKVFWDLTAPRVLTLERLPGVNIASLMAEPEADAESDADTANVDRKALAESLADSYLRQIFEMGLFHADPHPGNILVQKPDRLGLIDFGQVGIISDDFITELIVLIYACVNRELELAIDTLIDMGAIGPHADHVSIERKLRSFIDKYYGLPVKRMHAATLLNEFVDSIRGEDITIPREFSQLIKAVATVSITITQLDPDLDLVELLRPRLRQALKDRLSPLRLSRSTTRMGWDVLTAIRKAPRRLRALFRRFGTGSWQLQVRHENIERLIQELDRSSNRLAFSIVIAAIIIGSSVVVSASTELSILGFRFQYLGIIGYLMAGILGLALAWAIFRSGRLH